MEKKRIGKKILLAAAAVICVLLLEAAAAFAVLAVKTASIRDDWPSVYSDERYSTPVSVEGIEAITQEVSCGYAVIEMFSTWSGHDITEESLYAEYGKVVTSTGKAFVKEMNKRFPEYRTTMYKYLKDTELIDTVYDHLSDGIPVPVEWAAKYGDEWTLHYSLITGVDIPNDRITVANPYGYTEEITLEEFIYRTRFDAYSGMPLFLRFAFALGIFEKNTVFTVEKLVKVNKD